MDEQRRKELQERRQRAAEAEERLEKKVRVGPKIATALSALWMRNVGLQDFNESLPLPTLPKWTRDMRQVPGLAAVYTSQERVAEVAACCDRTLGPAEGVIGFDEYRFLGTLPVSEMSVSMLVSAAFELQDSVLFCPFESDGIIIADYYRTSGMGPNVDFSLIVQGDELERKLAACFENILPISSPLWAKPTP